MGCRGVFSLTLCIMCLCLINQMEQQISELSVLPCARDCLKSLRCGWIVHDQTLQQCSPRESLDCKLLRNNAVQSNSLSVFERLKIGINLENRRSATFKLMNAEKTTCKKTKAACGIPPSVDDAAIKYNSQFPGSAATYTCREGLSFCRSVQKTITCLDSGSWEKLRTGCLQRKFLSSPVVVRCPLGTGAIVEINALPIYSKTFSITFNGEAESFIFYLTVEMDAIGDKKTVILGNRTGKSGWGPDEETETSAFKLLRPFNLRITVEKDQYVLVVDNLKLATFRHRTPPETITKIELLNNVKLNHLIFSHVTGG